MNDNKIANFIERFGGMIIGILIGLIIFNFTILYDFFKFILVIGVCGWLGNYIQKNKANVKEFLKNLIDRMQEKMKKVYIDLAIAVVCILLIVKYTVLFLLLVGICAAVWFLVLDDKQKTEIRNKITEFYR